MTVVMMLAVVLALALVGVPAVPVVSQAKFDGADVAVMTELCGDVRPGPTADLVVPNPAWTFGSDPAADADDLEAFWVSALNGYDCDQPGLLDNLADGRYVTIGDGPAWDPCHVTHGAGAVRGTILLSRAWTQGMMPQSEPESDPLFVDLLRGGGGGDRPGPSARPPPSPVPSDSGHDDDVDDDDDMGSLASGSGTACRGDFACRGSDLRPTGSSALLEPITDDDDDWQPADASATASAAAAGCRRRPVPRPEAAEPVPSQARTARDIAERIRLRSPRWSGGPAPFSFGPPPFFAGRVVPDLDPEAHPMRFVADFYLANFGPGAAASASSSSYRAPDRTKSETKRSIESALICFWRHAQGGDIDVFAKGHRFVRFPWRLFHLLDCGPDTACAITRDRHVRDDGHGGGGGGGRKRKRAAAAALPKAQLVVYR